MLCKHGNIAPCVECDIVPLKDENEAFRTMMMELVEALELFMNNPTPTGEDFDKARAAIAAYRKQGGEYD